MCHFWGLRLPQLRQATLLRHWVAVHGGLLRAGQNDRTQLQDQQSVRQLPKLAQQAARWRPGTWERRVGERPIQESGRAFEVTSGTHFGDRRRF